MIVEIATPMYGGQCHGQYHMSVMHLSFELHKRGHGVLYSNTYNESLIQRARNTLASRFLLRGQADVLLFIDSDMHFDAVAMVDMLEEGKDVIGAITPLKGINFQNIVYGCNTNKSMDNAEKFGALYNINHDLTDQDEEDLLNNKSIKVDRIGTGVMAISKNALEILSKKVKKYMDDSSGGADTPERFDFFPVTIELDESWGGNRMMSEDYNFCNLWKKEGGDVYAKAGVVHGHVGMYEYKGDIIEAIKIKRKITNNK